MTTKIWVGTDTGHEGDINTAANWSPSGVPEAGDDVYFENSSQSVTAGLDTLAAVTLGSLNIAQNYTGTIGTASAYLQAAATVCRAGYHYGPGTPIGSGRLMLDLKSVQSAITIDNSGTPTDTGKAAIRIKNTHASSTLTVNKGKVAFCGDTGETGQLASLTLNYVSNKGTDAEVYVGAGVTLATVKKCGGKLNIRCAVTTYTTYDGSDVISGSGAITTLYVKGGTVEANSTGTITTAEVSGGLLDLTKSPAARTITTLKVDPPGKVKYDPAVVTLTNKIQPITAAGVVAYQAMAS